MRRIEPHPIPAPHLQPGDTVRCENGEVAVVGVRAGAEFPRSTRRPGGIVQHAQGGDRAIKLVRKEVFREPEIQCDAAMQVKLQALAGIVIPQNRTTPSRQVGPQINPAERGTCQHLRVIRRQIQTDIECLFLVGGGRLVEFFAANPGIAPIVRRQRNRQAFFFCQR
jgi:hypothetical protein